MEKDLLIVVSVAKGISVYNDFVPSYSLALFWNALRFEHWLELTMTSEPGDGQEALCIAVQAC